MQAWMTCRESTSVPSTSQIASLVILSTLDQFAAPDQKNYQACGPSETHQEVQTQSQVKGASVFDRNIPAIGNRTLSTTRKYLLADATRKHILGLKNYGPYNAQC
jgi:hypothetical protein